MSTIDAKQNNLNDILHAKKYRIEYYQREYT